MGMPMPSDTETRPMTIFMLEPFSQARLLQGEQDKAVAGGVCAALCDHWLRAWLDHPTGRPADRLSQLAGKWTQIKLHQRSYGVDRHAHGPEVARQVSGARVGVGYDVDRTQIVMNAVGFSGLKGVILRDIGRIASSATWSLRFSGGGGHALAGSCGFQATTGNIGTMVVHLFDPNIGEYVTPLRHASDILDDMFRRIPLYQTVEYVTRKGASDLLE
jgi:hypothetical protein